MLMETRKQMRALIMSTLAFAVSFAVWTMFSVIGVRIAADLQLNDTQFGLLVATPILSGALARLPLGMLADRYGGRRVYAVLMLCVAVSIYALTFATHYWQYLGIGLFVGLAGGTFAVGSAYVSAWFGTRHQGTVMGVFGAGNAGAAITNLAAPLLVVGYGWTMVPTVYAAAMLAMAALFWLLTDEDPLHAQRMRQQTCLPLAQQLAPLRHAMVWRLGFFYFVVFGSFVAVALWLPKYYIGEYHLNIAAASFITLLFTLPSGVVRALGGWMSDRYGGRFVNRTVFWTMLVSLVLLAVPQTTLIAHGVDSDLVIGIGPGIMVFTILVFVLGLAQGIGKASVYRCIADYYPGQVGVVGGLVGVLGGLGGFVLPVMFGAVVDLTHLRSSAFGILLVLTVSAILWLQRTVRAEQADALPVKPRVVRWWYGYDESVARHGRQYPRPPDEPDDTVLVRNLR